MSTLPFQNTTSTFSLLTYLARRKAPLSMSHPFHGVVITQDLSLLSINAERALVRAGCHWLPTNLGDQIYLHSPEMTEIFAARVISIDARSGELSLGDFSQMDRAWANRGYERVQPRLPIHAVVRVEDGSSFTVALEDLSINGVGVLAYKLHERGFDLSPGQALKLEFDLPQSRARLVLPARLANIRYHGGHLACLGINIYPNLTQARSIERFINQRKVEIMAELDQVVSETFQPQSVKELYF